VELCDAYRLVELHCELGDRLTNIPIVVDHFVDGEPRRE
jgi:hypothetical protein